MQCRMKSFNCLLLCGARYAIPERETNQTRRQTVGPAHGSMNAGVTPPGRRGVQRHIVEHGSNTPLFKFVQHRLTLNIRRKQNIVHMRVVAAMGRDRWSAQKPLAFQRFQHFMITPPAGQAVFGNFTGLFQLRPQKGSDKLARKSPLPARCIYPLLPERNGCGPCLFPE